MYEDFLHFIWQFQYFEMANLLSTHKDSIQILNQGFPNTQAGADFMHARVLINGVEWIGDVEIHLKSSQWNQHQHQLNPQYNSVILHVVWEDDQPVRRADQSFMPTIALKKRVDQKWLYTYQSILNNRDPIPCAGQLTKVRDITKIMMLDRTLLKRLEEKAFLFKALLVKNHYDWEESTYQFMAQNFGFKVNSEPFLRLSQSIPLKYLAKHRDTPEQIEALFFGQAGFLDVSLEDDYHKRLVREYQFLSNKYQIDYHKLEASQWNFLRLRPANFPEVRIAQFATLITQENHFFSKCLESSFEELKQVFQIKPHEYWMKHYRFAKESKGKVGKIGQKSIENLLINTVVVVLVAYSREKSQQKYMEKALHILENIKAENNKILKMWAELGLTTQTAYDSQALIELYNNYCTPKKCLQCAIGLELLQK